MNDESRSRRSWESGLILCLILTSIAIFGTSILTGLMGLDILTKFVVSVIILAGVFFPLLYIMDRKTTWPVLFWADMWRESRQERRVR